MDISDWLNKIPASQKVFWVGAGISSSSPTCLPLGEALTRFSIKQIFGEKVCEHLENFWGGYQKFLIREAHYNYFQNLPRLESVLNIIDEVEKRSSGIDFSFLNGFKCFGAAPFNRNHLRLANFLYEGATIITSNFDLCIEQAYEYLTFGKDHLARKSLGSIIVYESDTNLKAGKIIHYHGSSDDVSELGATINEIKKGFSEDLEKKITNILAKASATVFLGYSFGDAFDVNLYFRNIPGLFRYNSAVFIQHLKKGDNDKNHPTEEDTKNENRIRKYLECFAYPKFEYRNTTRFLRSISGLKRIKIRTHKKFAWEVYFLKNVRTFDLEKVRPFLICRLANMIGVQVDQLSEDAFTKVQSFKKYFQNNEYLDTLAVVCRRKGEHGLEKKYHLQKISTNNKEDLLGYYYAIGNYKKALKYAESLSEIKREIKDPSKILTWKPYTSMSVFCRPLIQKYIKNPLRRKVTKKDHSQIMIYLELLKLLSQRHLKNVNFTNQVDTSLRFIMLFDALIYGKDDVDIQDQIQYLYGEVSSVEGFISAYRDFAIKSLLLAKFHRKSDEYVEAKMNADLSTNLAIIAGDVPGRKRGERLKQLISISKMIN